MSDGGGATVPVQRWYLLDAEDRIEAVDPGWDVPVAEGSRAASRQVVGQPLKSFLAGDSTRMFLDAALQAARITGKARRLAYRCDAPDLVRKLEMVVTPLAGGRVRVDHLLLGTRPRPSLPPLRVRTAAPVRRGVLRCSQCQLFSWPALGEHWQEGEAWRAQLSPASLGRPRQVTDVVCPSCQQALRSS